MTVQHQRGLRHARQEVDLVYLRQRLAVLPSAKGQYVYLNARVHPIAVLPKRFKGRIIPPALDIRQWIICGGLVGAGAIDSRKKAGKQSIKERQT